MSEIEPTMENLQDPYVLQLIEALSAATDEIEQRWISVEDRLPSETKQIEVVFYASPYAWQTGLFTPDGFCGQEGDVFQRHDHMGDDCYHTVEGVTHWMALPKPPATKGQDDG